LEMVYLLEMRRDVCGYGDGLMPPERHQGKK
jgi:hypothetical protein